MNQIYQWFKSYLNINHEMANKILISLFVIILFFLIQNRILKIAHEKVEDYKARYTWQKVSGYITLALVAVFISLLWLKDSKDLSVVLGLFSAGVAIALKDLVINIAGWFFITWRKPFYIGDRIQIGEYKGDIADVRLFQFSILEIGNWVEAEQFTGRIVHIPTGKVFSEIVFNYNRGFNFIWDEIPVLITSESDWEKAKDIVQKIAEKHTSGTSNEAKKHLSETSKKFLINIKNLEPTTYTKIEPFGTLVTIRYLSLPRERRNTHELISEDILKEFAKYENIDFAYPTYRIYSNLLEGKSVKKSESGSINLSFANPFSRK